MLCTPSKTSFQFEDLFFTFTFPSYRCQDENPLAVFIEIAHFYYWIYGETHKHYPEPLTNFKASETLKNPICTEYTENKGLGFSKMLMCYS